MRKIILTIGALACLLPAVTVSARSLVVTLPDDATVYYLLNDSDAPVMQFSEGKILLRGDSYEFAGIKNFFISESDAPSGISEVTMSRPEFHLDNNTLLLQGEGEVAVYSVDGIRMDLPVSYAEGENLVSVDISGLEKNTYIVKFGKTSFKFLKK